MSFTFAPAVRDRVSIILALAAASGGGKTRSALAIARGMAGGDDSRIAVIDTEAGRAKHYAITPGEQQSDERFAFQHGDLQAPFSPEAYMDAIKAADDTGRFDVIVVDSCSHEWEGEGGLHDEHQDAVAAAVEKQRNMALEKGWRFDEAMATDKASIGAWKEPKRRHKRFVSRLLQCRAHIILCLRAEEKLRIETVEDDRGRKKTVIVQAKDLPEKQRWVPICEKRFLFEVTISLILTPHNPGIPIPIKLQDQHRAAIPLDRHLSEDTGRALAEWARGGSVSPGARKATDAKAAVPSNLPPEDHGGTAVQLSADALSWDSRLATAAHMGTKALQDEWAKVPRDIKTVLVKKLDETHKPAAAKAGEGTPA